MSDLDEPAPLRADARRMLATWREADAMPRAAKARVWKRMRARPRPPAPRYDVAWVWAVAIAAAVLLVWWGVAQVRRAALDGEARPVDQAVDHRDVPPGEHDVVEPPPPASPPVVAQAPAPAIAPPVQKPAEVVRPSARPRVEPSTDTAPDATTTLARERDVIARAWSALADADYGAALHRAAEHAQSFPNGILAPERRAIEVIARCKRGDRDADAAGRAWLDEHPRSPLANRVRVACE